MYVNEKNKITTEEEYFYNKFTGDFCVIGTTISTQGLCDLEELFESPELMKEVPMPDYITEDYDKPTW